MSCNHHPTNWKAQTDPQRAGWVKVYCQCGKWMGDRPVDVKAYQKRGKRGR